MGCYKSSLNLFVLVITIMPSYLFARMNEFSCIVYSLFALTRILTTGLYSLLK